jgi:hypothetical protein
VTFYETLTVRNDFYIIYIPENYLSQTTVLPQISDSEASIAKNFNGGITFFDDETTVGILLNTVVSWII